MQFCSGPGTVGSTQRRPAEEGAMTKFCPARPLHMLPSYHGRKRVDEVINRLANKGDYLLVTDMETAKLIVCVKSESDKVHQLRIVKKFDGKFVIEGDLPHQAQGFSNVDQLITYYRIYGLAVKEEKPPEAAAISVTLDTPITVKSDDEPPSDRRRPFRQPKDLNHFHSRLPQEDAEKLLEKVGDFLLRVNPRNQFEHILTVRGPNTFVHRKLARDPESGGFALPVGSEGEPVEYVDSLDEWIQFHVLFEVPIDGFNLIRAVGKEKSETADA